MQTVDTQQAEETEQQLIDMAAAAVRQSNWTIGEAASKWTERYSRGRTDADFAELIGSSQRTVNDARRVFERFGLAPGAKHNGFGWRNWRELLSWTDAEECLAWAEATGATFREMEVWRRVKNGEPLTPEPPKAPTQQAAEPDPPLVVPEENGTETGHQADERETQSHSPPAKTQGKQQEKWDEIETETGQTATTVDLKAGSRTAIQSLRKLAKQANQADRKTVATSLRRLADEFDPPTLGTTDMPASLAASGEFQTAWKDWGTYRKEKGKKLTPSTVKRQFTKLEAMGPAQAVRTINHSIEQGWTGLFSPDGADSGGTVSPRVHNKDLSKPVVYRDFD